MNLQKINVFQEGFDLSAHLKRFPPEMEGGVHQIPQQMNRLRELSKSCKNIMEIGFNAGASARVFLESALEPEVVSFDLGSHDYCTPNKKEIDSWATGRHTLIIGDSLETVPQYVRDRPGMVFDLILIDGGHIYEIAKADFINCKALAHHNTVVIMDDVVTDASARGAYNYLEGPSKVWEEGVKSGEIEHLGGEEYVGLGRGMAWFKYNT